MISKIIIISLLPFLVGATVLAQSGMPIGKVYIYADKFPQFKGGFAKIKLFLKQNLKWPDNSTDIQGTVLLSFIVSVEGGITSVKIEKSLSPKFDEEAKRVVKLMPKWVPGKVGQNNVNVKVYFPIEFAINN
jgi:protein TonB